MIEIKDALFSSSHFVRFSISIVAFARVILPIPKVKSNSSAAPTAKSNE